MIWDRSQGYPSTAPDSPSHCSMPSKNTKPDSANTRAKKLAKDEIRKHYRTGEVAQVDTNRARCIITDLAPVEASGIGTYPVLDITGQPTTQRRDAVEITSDDRTKQPGQHHHQSSLPVLARVVDGP